MGMHALVQADIDEAAIENTIFILEQKKYDENAFKQVMEFLLNFTVVCLFFSLEPKRILQKCKKKEDIFQIQG